MHAVIIIIALAVDYYLCQVVGACTVRAAKKDRQTKAKLKSRMLM